MNKIPPDTAVDNSRTRGHTRDLGKFLFTGELLVDEKHLTDSLRLLDLNSIRVKFSGCIKRDDEFFFNKKFIQKFQKKFL